MRERLVAALAEHPQIKRAYLVRKQVKRMPEEPLYVLAVFRRGPWYRFEKGTEDQQLASQLYAALHELPISLQYYVSSQSRVLRRIARVPNAQIHP